MIIRIRCRLVFAFLCIVVSYCSHTGTDIAGGNTSDVGNGVIMGKILQPDGTGATNAVVRIVPADFTPDTGSTQPISFPEVVADASGFYVLSNITGGIYTIEASRDSFGTIVDSIAVPVIRDTTVVPDALLIGTGTITGVSYMISLDYYSQSRQNIFIRGTSFLTGPEYGGRFILENVPAGSYTLTIRPMYPRFHVDIDVTVSAGATADLDTIYHP